MTPEITNIPRIPRVTEGAHCSYCVMDNQTVRKIKQFVLIFLDMDRVMIVDRISGETSKAIDRTINEMFGIGDKTELQWRRAASRHLDVNAVERLMGMIQAIEAVGKQVGIVISSMWRRDGTTKQVCYDMFDCQRFEPYIIGRTASKDRCDWQFHLCADKPAFLNDIKTKYGFELTDRGFEIRHWLLEHQAGRDFVIYDDINDGISEQFKNRFIQTFNCLEDVHVEKGLELLGIKDKPSVHCPSCNMNQEAFSQVSDKWIFFLDVDDLLDEGSLTEPLGGQLVKSLTRIGKGQKRQIYKTSKKIPVNVLTERSLAYLMDKMRALGRDAGIVLIATWQNKTADEITKSRFKMMYFHQHLLGVTGIGMKGIDAWVNRHHINKYSVLNLVEQFGRGEKSDVDAFVRSLGILNKPIPDKINLHCKLCILDKSQVKTVKKMVIIFLDIVDVLIESYKCKPSWRSKSHPWEIMPADLMDPKAVERLMFIIHSIEKSGRQIGIVITSGWRKRDTTEAVCTEMFASQPINPYIVGITTRKRDTIHKQSGMMPQVRHWSRKHNVDDLYRVVFHNKHAIFPKEFHAVKVNYLSLLAWKDILAASRMLPQELFKKEIPEESHCKFCILDSKEHQILREGIILFIDKKKLKYQMSIDSWKFVDSIMEEIESDHVKGRPVGLVLYKTSNKLNSSTYDSTVHLCTKTYEGLPFNSYFVGRVQDSRIKIQKLGEPQPADLDPMQAWIDEHQPKEHRKLNQT